MKLPKQVPEIFKGIALFTPGGDVIYTIDPHKRDQWHINLCNQLQHIFHLCEPPHFLIPGYTATIDNCYNNRSQTIETIAEVYPGVQRYQVLLNAIFSTKNLVWQVHPWQEKECDPCLLETYRSRFPQLWEEHNLVQEYNQSDPAISLPPEPAPPSRSGYVLRLFVSSNHEGVETILQNIHSLLENQLHSPYTLKLIDVYKNPEQAELNQVSATPTLIRVWPQPVRRIVGELNDLPKVLQILTTG